MDLNTIKKNTFLIIIFDQQLDAIKKFVGRGDVEGIIEADETFFLESFKGNHKKSDFVMPRKPHKRGGEAKTSGI